MTLTTPTTASPRPVVPHAVLDAVLTAQLAIAWAGENGTEPRLKWWRTDLVSEFGGEDLLQRLLPHTWRWAVLQGAREAAQRRDSELRAQDANPDRVISLFRLGFAIDEQVEGRLADLKRTGTAPLDALPALRELLASTWSKDAFANWVLGHGDAACVPAPLGRRVTGSPPESIELLMRKLVAALHPLTDAYPLPHFRTQG